MLNFFLDKLEARSKKKKELQNAAIDNTKD